MFFLIGFFSTVGLIFGGLAVAAIFTRLAYAVTDKIAFAPALDFFISLFTWIPWVAGVWLMGWWGLLAAVIAHKVVVLDAITCCGYAGDKGLFIPELNAHATRRVGKDVPSDCQLGVSTVSTCASGLSEHAGIPFVRLPSLLEWASRP